MKTIALALGMPESATEAEINVSLSEVLAENKRLKDEKTARELAEKTAQKDQAIALVDKAVKEGKINASAKESFLSLFDDNFDAAKLSLESIPARQNIASLIDKNGDTSKIASLQKLSWDELDRSGNLETVKLSYPDLFAEKFKAKFNKEYKPNK